MTQPSETEKYELQSMRQDLCIELRNHQAKLTELKNLIRTSGRMARGEYKRCCELQNEHNAKIAEISAKLLKIKLRGQQLADIEFKARQGASREEDKSIVVSLVALREEYQKFSADNTRVSSMRQMAAEFVLKLNPIIKNAVNP